MKHFFACVLALPLAAQAQTPPVLNPRWQVETLAHYQRFEGLSGGGDAEVGGTAVFFGPLLQASYRLCPQLSVGAGLGAARRGWHSVPTVFYPDFGLTIQTRNTSLCAPLWLRWHLSERPAARCQVALQAGAMLLSQTATTRLLDDGPNGRYVIVELAAATRRTLPLTLGLRLDYRVAPHWQVVGQVQTTALDANRFGGGASLGVACDW